MKTESEVKQRYRTLYQKHLDKYLHANLRPAHLNCVHNVRHEDKHGVIHLCFLGSDDPENWPGNVCDTDEIAQACPFFTPKKSKEDLVRDFDPTQYPDLVALQWVMDTVQDLEPVSPRTWYQRFWAWLARKADHET